MNVVVRGIVCLLFARLLAVLAINLLLLFGSRGWELPERRLLERKVKRKYATNLFLNSFSDICHDGVFVSQGLFVSQ